MKVNIGPYRNWIGPYQISRKFEWLIGEDRADKLGDWIASTKINDFCSWLDKKKKRKVKIRIDGYDTWNAEHTLALIIHPLLVAMKDNKAGSPYVDDEDVPKHIRSTAAKPTGNDYDVDEFHYDRWDWVLNEMTWTFEQYTNERRDDQFDSGVIDVSIDSANLVYGPNHTHRTDTVAKAAYDLRLKNGRMLFAKYYESLWS